MQNGKGSRVRPHNKEVFDKNFSEIRWDYPKKKDLKNLKDSSKQKPKLYVQEF